MIGNHSTGRLIDLDDNCWTHPPGTLVRLFHAGRKRGYGLGLVIATDGELMTVLWSQAPDSVKVLRELDAQLEANRHKLDPKP